MLRKLAEIANKLDSLKLYKEADKVDSVIKRMAQMDDEFDFPMVDTNNKPPKHPFAEFYGVDMEDYIYSSEPPEIEESKLKSAISFYISKAFYNNSWTVRPRNIKKIEWTNDFGPQRGGKRLSYCWKVTFEAPSTNGLMLKDGEVLMCLVNEYDYPVSDAVPVSGIGHDGSEKLFFLHGE